MSGYGSDDDAQDANLILNESALERHRLELSNSNVNLSSICIDCGEDIPPIRLQVQHRADRCLDCQTAQEQEDRHYARTRRNGRER